MARRGWATTNYLERASGVVTAAPLTIACWGKTTITGDQMAVQIVNAASTAGTNGFYLKIDATNHVNATTGDAAAGSSAVSSTALATSAWGHLCAVFASATDRRAILNGGGKGTNSTSRVPASIDRTTIGTIRQATALQPWAPAGTGDLAEVAIWNVALSDADVASLALGIHPFLVRPDALVAYWPLIGTYSPEINLKSNASVMTMGGTVTQSAHPPIFMPPRGAVNRRPITPPALVGQIMM